MSAPPLPPQLPMSGPSDSGTDADLADPPIPPPNAPPFSPFPQPFPRIRTIRSGCWLVNYEPNGIGLLAYDGTIRVERNGFSTTASGDLYQRPVITIPFPRPRRFMLPPPNPADGIPVQARRNYRFYLRITNIPEFFVFGNSFDLGFEMWRFDAATNTFAGTAEATVTATMSWVTAPAGYPSHYLQGDVQNAAGAVIGRLKMGWISPLYRKMSVEIDTVAGSERPEDNGAGEDWGTVLSKVGFEGNIILSNTDVTKPGDDSYSDADMHDAMLDRRDPINLDTTWHYHILAVRIIESTERGIMYDSRVTDSNNVPREGLGISSHWVADDIPLWGDVRNTRWGASKPAYFRTAVHELGHAFGLEHNDVDNGYMRPSPSIAGSPGGPFPRQVKWAFADDDLKRLRHWSDVFVRPGGLEFGAGSRTGLPITPTDLDIELSELSLEVKPLLTEVPLGAPVRVELRLTNNGDAPIEVPESIGLDSPFTSGTVTSAGAAPRTFRPLRYCTDARPVTTLHPTGSSSKPTSLTSSLTLLRGAEGALFPTVGVAEVVVTLAWALEDGQSRATVAGSTTVLVTSTATASHAEAAHRMLTAPDAHVLLVIGGDCKSLRDGKKAIARALEDETLRPHYAAVEARRLATKFHGKQDLKGAEQLVKDQDVVLSAGERAALKKKGIKCGGERGVLTQ